MTKKHSTDSPPAPQTPEGLSALAERLVHHADNVRNPAATPMAEDMREASRIIAKWLVEVIQGTTDDAARTRLTKLMGGAWVPVYINPDDDGLAPMITYEDATHIVVTLEIPKATLRKMQRFIQALLAITVAE
jgi:hypothetical protein